MAVVATKTIISVNGGRVTWGSRAPGKLTDLLISVGSRGGDEPLPLTAFSATVSTDAPNFYSINLDPKLKNFLAACTIYKAGSTHYPKANIEKFLTRALFVFVPLNLISWDSKENFN